MPTLTLEQFMYEDTGVLLNGDSALPFADIESIQGLDSAPFRTQTHDREGTDGGYVDSEFLTARTVTLEGTVYASPTSLETYLDSLKANFAPTSIAKPLYFGTDAGQRVVFGKAQGFRYNKDSARRLGTAKFQAQVICEDPRIYTDTLISQQVTRATGTLNITVGGNRLTPAKITITGANTGPSVIYTRTSTTMVFTGYVLAAGQSIAIDLDNRTVIQAGTTSKRSIMTLTGNWFLLAPGVNTFTFGGTGTSSTLKVETRSAWQ